MQAPSPLAPLRRLGLVDLLALGVNAVVGAGVFLMPGLLAEKLGPAAVVATLAAGLCAFVLALSTAEAASRFDDTGGPYLYAREAFGPGPGFLVGWVVSWTGLVAWAALLASFATALSFFLPAATGGWPRAVAILGLAGLLGLLNVLGIHRGALVSNLASVAKLGVLVVFLLAGLPAGELARFEPFAPHGFALLPEATLLMLYAYVGFENLIVPAGEMKAPRRHLPVALCAVMGTVLLLYLGVQIVSTATLPDLAGHANPVAEAARAFLGPAGGTLIGVGVLVSILGVNAASAIVAPRRFHAMASKGELPAWLARLHPERATPWAAIAFTYTLAAALALSGSFRQLAVVTVVSRLLQYAATCLAVLALRRRGPAPFRLPGGALLPVLGLAVCLGLATAAGRRELLAAALVVGSGLAVWWGFLRSRGDG